LDLTGNVLDLAGLASGDRSQGRTDERKQIGQSVALGDQHHNSESGSGELLLKREVLIRGQEYFKSAIGGAAQ
jgi:hypothetical protein